MEQLTRLLKRLFDVRPGEYLTITFMTLYLMFVLFAYYIIKPVSRALFLNSFDIDKLPWLYVLIAAIGGTLAYLYTKVAVRSSLRRAVDFANIFCVGMLVLFWWLIRLKLGWVIYAFNVWVSLFSIMLVSQGWLVAANVYSAREAKRLYGILGVGSVIGAAFGGTFSAYTVYYVGTTNLLLASAVMVVLSYVACRFAIASSGKTLAHARGAEEEEKFSFNEILQDIGRHRHLQVIIAIMVITFMVDVMVDFQFSAFAKATYKGQDLTAFLGQFYGFWLNVATFFLQMFATTFIVSRFGVGPALQAMPVAIGCASLAALLSPSLLSTAATRLTEASTRYSLNKTATELLYLPLPLELRNRTKAFVDVFVDRLSRGIGGMVLVLLGAIGLSPSHFAAVVLAISIVWILLSFAAQREYIATVRKRLEFRRLDFGSARIKASDAETIRLLERTAREGSGRQAAYALEVLSQSGAYNVQPLAVELSESPHVEVRAKAFELARRASSPALYDRALAEIRYARGEHADAAAREAVLYAMSVTPEPVDLARRLLEHRNLGVRQSTVEALAMNPEAGRQLMNAELIARWAASADPRDRMIAAAALKVAPVEDAGVLSKLIADPNSAVATEAMRTAAALRNRLYVPDLVRALAHPAIRGTAIDALAAYGSRITGTITDLLEDEDTPLNIRRHLPRVLQRIPEQRSVDALVRVLPTENLLLRSAVLKALNKLRDAAPGLNYGAAPLIEQVHAEARTYFELHASLAALRECNSAGPATALLIRTLEHRLRLTLERVFRLLGLKYPPKQIHAAYLALDHRNTEEFTAALEFLDNVLERELKRILLALLDEDAALAQKGRELFRVERRDAAGALRNLIHSGDMWLAACAIAAAAELKARDLAADIQQVGESGGREVSEVARSAAPALV